jgi:hypothetical protein
MGLFTQHFTRASSLPCFDHGGQVKAEEGKSHRKRCEHASYAVRGCLRTVGWKPAIRQDRKPALPPEAFVRGQAHFAAHQADSSPTRNSFSSYVRRLQIACPNLSQMYRQLSCPLATLFVRNSPARGLRKSISRCHQTLGGECVHGDDLGR